MQLFFPLQVPFSVVQTCPTHHDEGGGQCVMVYLLLSTPPCICISFLSLLLLQLGMKEGEGSCHLQWPLPAALWVFRDTLFQAWKVVRSSTTGLRPVTTAPRSATTECPLCIFLSGVPARGPPDLSHDPLSEWGRLLSTAWKSSSSHLL